MAFNTNTIAEIAASESTERRGFDCGWMKGDCLGLGRLSRPHDARGSEKGRQGRRKYYESRRVCGEYLSVRIKN